MQELIDKYLKKKIRVIEDVDGFDIIFDFKDINTFHQWMKDVFGMAIHFLTWLIERYDIQPTTCIVFDEVMYAPKGHEVDGKYEVIWLESWTR